MCRPNPLLCQLLGDFILSQGSNCVGHGMQGMRFCHCRQTVTEPFCIGEIVGERMSPTFTVSQALKFGWREPHAEMDVCWVYLYTVSVDMHAEIHHCCFVTVSTGVEYVAAFLQDSKG